MTDKHTPRLYLDIDGVLLADNPRLRSGSKEYDGTRYAPEVLRRLGNTSLELVWLTTWGADEVSQLTTDLDVLHGGRQLKRGPGSDWKLSAVITDQTESPSPFVWADDRISPEDVLILEAKLGRQNNQANHLLISPDEHCGITKSHLAHIEAFARAYQ